MDSKEITIIVLGIIILVVFVFFTAVSLEYISVKNSCETWKLETGRPTKFVSNYPWYFDCYTKTKSGWISAYKLEQIETPNVQKVAK